MSVAMYEISVPVFEHGLKTLDRLLDKGEAHAAAKKIDPEALLSARLYPDMLPLFRQIHLASDSAKGAGARLAGIEVPSFPDVEKTFPELKARIAKTLDFLATLKPEQFAGAETREVSLKAGPRTLTFSGIDYLKGFVLPNFYFHQTITYAILRHSGVELGKLDYLGVARS